MARWRRRDISAHDSPARIGLGREPAVSGDTLVGVANSRRTESETRRLAEFPKSQDGIVWKHVCHLEGSTLVENRSEYRLEERRDDTDLPGPAFDHRLAGVSKPHAPVLLVMDQALFVEFLDHASNTSCGYVQVFP